MSMLLKDTLGQDRLFYISKGHEKVWKMISVTQNDL